MRRGYLLFYIFWLLLPQTANAALMVPSADVTVNVETIGGDASFDFQFYGSGSFSHAENFTLITQNGSASRAIHIPFVDSTFYNLDQTLPAGWTIENVVCTGNYSVSGGDVRLFIAPFSTTTCTVTNKKTVIRNPVIFIPGITGTELFDGIEKLWPDPVKMAFDLGDQFMDPLGFNSSLQPLSNISLGGVVKNPSGLYNYSQELINDLQIHGYQENQDLFTFPYDWRFGTNETNAQLLKNKINNILLQTGASKVDVVAHSAGGVLLKKYVLDNSEHRIGKAVFVGVPNLGAPKALKILLEGDNMGIPVLSAKEIKNIARNMPGVYQLTPSAQYHGAAGASFATHTQNLTSSSDHDFGFSEMQTYLSESKNLNTLGFERANYLHTTDFDTVDLSSRGVDVYNIVGCKQPTLGKIIERRTDNPLLSSVVNGYAIKYTAGDGTVPLVSAERAPAPGSPIYYALSSDHGKMPSQNGIRQQIVGLVKGQDSPVAGMTTNRNLCKLNGKMISIYSPLDISVTDEFGNVTKVSEGDVQTDIPGSNLEVLDDHKFLFLPEGDYQIYVEGTGEGSFTLINESVIEGQVTEQQVYMGVPVSTGDGGSLSIGGNNLLLEGETIAPDYILSGDQIIDSSAWKVDTTPPEFTIQFDPVLGDLVFSGDGVVTDSDNVITLTDPAGNTTELVLKEKERKKKQKAEILSLSYNGVPADVNKNKLVVAWKNSGGKLMTLKQKLKSKQEFNIEAEYNGRKTKLSGKDQTGRINETFPGLVILKVHTEQGDLKWSY